MSGIVHLLVERITDYLAIQLITNVSSSDPSRANLVKMYRFQQDPTTTPVYATVSGGNPQDPALIDGRIDAGGLDRLGIGNMPSGEIGGGHLWWRRGRVDVATYFLVKKFDEEVAGTHAHTFMSRVMYHLERTPVSGLVDDFGETALEIYIHSSNFFESGGPPDQYIWRGQISWQVLTARPL